MTSIPLYFGDTMAKETKGFVRLSDALEVLEPAKRSIVGDYSPKKEKKVIKEVKTEEVK